MRHNSNMIFQLILDHVRTVSSLNFTMWNILPSVNAHVFYSHASEFIKHENLRSWNESFWEFVVFFKCLFMIVCWNSAVVTWPCRISPDFIKMCYTSLQRSLTALHRDSSYSKQPWDTEMTAVNHSWSQQRDDFFFLKLQAKS